MSPKRAPIPIMSADDERYMAFEGLVQWTTAIVEQGKRVEAATARMAASQGDFRLVTAQVRTEHHYFAIAAHKVLEHRDWVLDVGLCANVDFSVLDTFSSADVRDLRNMREHVIDYFRGVGQDKQRWEKETPEFKADASTANGTLIGGRLDWKQFMLAGKTLLPILLAQPIPYPARP